MAKISGVLTSTRLLTIWGAACSFLLIIGVYQGTRGLAHSEDIKGISARNDCRSAYNALLTAEKDKLVELRSDAQIAFNKALLHAQALGERASLEDVVLFDRINQDLEAQRVLVDTLPRLDQAVENGWSLGSRSYPACPGG